MKIVVDNRIPYIEDVLDSVAEVVYLPSPAITPDAVRDAEALLVRTRTQCNEALLAGSHVHFIGSATIGTDHIDLDWCRAQGITVRNAPGCNAPAVAQWVFAAIGHWMRDRDINCVQGLTLGVIGVGHVGGIVARWGQQLGFKVLPCDPPLGIGGSLEELLEYSDIVTVHTPLTHDGQWATWHLIGDAQLRQLKSCRLLINAARGGIIDEAALTDWSGDLAIDCWENEPRLSPATLQRAIVATPHIAGYSIEGKQRGTAMMIEALNRHYGWQLPVPHITASPQGSDHVTLQGIEDSFDPKSLTTQLKSDSTQFELLRNTYPLRREYR